MRTDTWWKVVAWESWENEHALVPQRQLAERGMRRVKISLDSIHWMRNDISLTPTSSTEKRTQHFYFALVSSRRSPSIAYKWCVSKCTGHCVHRVSQHQFSSIASQCDDRKYINSERVNSKYTTNSIYQIAFGVCARPLSGCGGGGGARTRPFDSSPCLHLGNMLQFPERVANSPQSQWVVALVYLSFSMSKMVFAVIAHCCCVVVWSVLSWSIYHKLKKD